MFSFLKRDKAIFIILFFYSLFVVFTTPLSAHADMTLFFLPWIKYFVSGGIEHAYKDPLINYPPITLYVMYIYGVAVNLLKMDLAKVIYYFKDLVFLFDLATFYFVAKILQHFKLPLYKIIFLLGNVSLLYNTIFWGQVDTIYTFFAVFSVYFVLTKRPLISIIGLICALASKPQAIIFIPVIVLLLVPYFYNHKALFLKAILVVLVTTAVIFMPFLLLGTISDYIQTLQRTTVYYPFVSMFAFNFWLLVFGIDKISQVPDAQQLLGISYRNLGLGLFFFWTLTFLYPVLAIAKKQLKRFRSLRSAEWQIVFLSLTLITIAFFFFNTQMHERYVHAAIIFAGIYAVLSGRYIIYIAASVAYIANLTYIFNSLPFNPSSIVTPFFAAILFAAILLYGTIELYRLQALNKKQLEHDNP